MEERGWGKIIHIATIGARTGGNIKSAPYKSSKVALVALAKNPTRNFGSCGVTVNAIVPGLSIRPWLAAGSGPRIRLSSTGWRRSLWSARVFLLGWQAW